VEIKAETTAVRARPTAVLEAYCLSGWTARWWPESGGHGGVALASDGDMGSRFTRSTRSLAVRGAESSDPRCLLPGRRTRAALDGEFLLSVRRAFAVSFIYSYGGQNKTEKVLLAHEHQCSCQVDFFSTVGSVNRSIHLTVCIMYGDSLVVVFGHVVTSTISLGGRVHLMPGRGKQQVLYLSASGLLCCCTLHYGRFSTYLVRLLNATYFYRRAKSDKYA
jgi:hypothetical protein